jgi:type II secretory pathway component PulK
MNDLLHTVWRTLTRPRELSLRTMSIRSLPEGALPLRGAARSQQGRRSGVAILMVVATLMVMTVVVTEIAYGSRVRLLTAAHQRDRVQAYWLARSGSNLYSLILMANKELAKNSALSGMAETMGIPIGDALWQMIPVLNTGIIRMLMGGGDVEDEDVETFKSTGHVSDEIAEESREGGLFSDRNFLDFDGDFMAEVTDHESRININAFTNDTAQFVRESSTAQQVLYLMSGDENDAWLKARNLNAEELVGNLKDWVDKDTMRSGGLGGYEDSLYNTLDPPYLTKNAPFDTVQEMRVVAGWEGEVTDRFGEYLTVFGDSAGKVNILTAPPEVLNSLVRACAQPPPNDDQLGQCTSNIDDNTFGFPPSGSDDFASRYLQYCGIELDKQCLKDKVTESSSTFTITSTGLVGTSSVTITAIMDFNRKSIGEKLYWRVD